MPRPWVPPHPAGTTLGCLAALDRGNEDGAIRSEVTLGRPTTRRYSPDGSGGAAGATPAQGAWRRARTTPTSSTSGWASTRECVVQVWPPFLKIAVSTVRSNASMSASGRTMAADLPPSSSVILFNMRPATSPMACPAAVEPGGRDLVDARVRHEGASGLHIADHDASVRQPAARPPQRRRRGCRRPAPSRAAA